MRKMPLNSAYIFINDYLFTTKLTVTKYLRRSLSGLNLGG